ncbi:alpha/beta-hydrolase [Exidia glandulosa HHB12029]|uniref:Alpha/beta-hydrolase n=1 Tax=Exidia glandulosa HHB12029 TaxID=1314781 RepID=A0A165NG79_EXIGL|nr:alpha/beta-hydrolase [Exidia glandulosa HHB12029]
MEGAPILGAPLSFFQRAAIYAARLATPFIASKPIRNGILSTGQSIQPAETLLIQSSKDATRNIAVKLFFPPNTSAEERASMPVYLNLHAGAFVLDLFGMDDEFCTYIAQEAMCTVVDGDYAKAPDHPFPAAYYDVLDVANWILAQSARWDVRRFSAGGFSAGGGLALSIAPHVPLRSIMGFAPSTNLSTWALPRGKGEPKFKGPPVQLLSMLYDAYVSDGADRRDPRVSPFYAAPGKFPPITIAYGMCDAHFSDLQAFGHKVKAAGVDKRDETLHLMVTRLRESWKL